MSQEEDFGATLSTPLGATLRTPSSDPSAATLQQLPNVGAYEPGNLLGRGGMGEVRLCRDPRLGRDIALKTATTRNAEELERFVREAQIQGQLQHPSIVPVHELGVGPDGIPFFTMKQIKGHTLQEVMHQLRSNEPGASTRFNRHRLLSAFLSVCQAVEFAHTNNWIHRDIKPANIMLGDFGEVYVLDWGLAKRSDQVEPQGVPFADLKLSPVGATTPGTLLGTPGYMAPEQVLGLTANVRSDVYALGAVLFEILTHQMLVIGTTAMELLISTRAGADARARTRAPEREVSPELEAICLKATQREPAERFATVRELHDSVERVLAGERNLVLRSDLAKQHAEAASAAALRIRGGSGDELELRKLALKEVGLALALDATHPLALKVLVALMTTPPAVIPPEAQAEIDAGHSQQVRSSARAAAVGFALYMIDLPLMLMMGPRHPWMLAVAFSLVAAAAAASGWTGFIKKQPTSMSALPALLLSNLAIAAGSLLTGPFLVVPAMAAANTIVFVFFLERRYWKLVIGLGIVTVAAPIFTANHIDHLQKAFEFTAQGGLLIHPIAVNMPEMGMMTFLACSSIGTLLISALVVAAARSRYEALEKHRAVQAWNFRQFVPPEGVVGAPTEASYCANPFGNA
jgi:eukaryotic-like serine/threonine-protein kinase